MIQYFKNSLATRILAVVLAFATLNASMAYASHTEAEGPILKAGTMIRLQTTQSIDSQTAKSGDQVQLRVMQEVRQDGMVLIPAGALAMGHIANAKAAGAFGAAGRLELNITSVVAADGTTVPLSGIALQRQGKDNQTTSILLGIFVCFLFWFMEGEPASIPQGTELLGTVTYDIELR